MSTSLVHKLVHFHVICNWISVEIAIFPQKKLQIVTVFRDYSKLVGHPFYLTHNGKQVLLKSAQYTNEWVHQDWTLE